MDTETVFKIIAMLDTRIDHYEQLVHMDYGQGAQWALNCFREHLQECIELEVAQVEGT